VRRDRDAEDVRKFELKARTSHATEKEGAMLVLSRKPTESIIINDDIVVTVLSVQGNKVRLGVEAPSKIRVLRGELDRRQAIVVPHRSPIMRRLSTIQCHASWK
jgi:carbon storage regulator